MGHTTILRALAALLIINSHLESCYPIRQAAVDGLVGNSLFFLLAGLGLVASERRSRRSFPEWYGRRLVRILPSVALAVLLFYYLPNRGWATWSAADYARNFFIPPAFEFVRQILVLYIPFFVIQRLGGARANQAVLVASLLATAAVPWLGDRAATIHPYHWLYYFQMMLFGAWIGWRPGPTRRIEPAEVAAFAGLSLAYAAAKLAASRDDLAGWYFVPHLLLFPLLYLLIRLSGSETLARLLAGNRRLAATIGLIGGVTLELYLVHYMVLDSPVVGRLPFPLNVAAIFAGSLVLALGLAWLVDRARRGAGWLYQRRPASAG